MRQVYGIGFSLKFQFQFKFQFKCAVLVSREGGDGGFEPGVFAS